MASAGSQDTHHWAPLGAKQSRFWVGEMDQSSACGQTALLWIPVLAHMVNCGLGQWCDMCAGVLHIACMAVRWHLVLTKLELWYHGAGPRQQACLLAAISNQ